MKGKTSV